MKKSKKPVQQVSLRNVKLSRDSKKQLKKIKNKMWGNVADAIESVEWFVPSDTHEFIDVKTSLEEAIPSFFDLKQGVLVEIDSYESDIMSFEKGIYPKYS